MTNDNLAKIKSKGASDTGLTEDLARKLFDNPGMHLMAIVELTPAERHIKTDGQHVVDLEITAIEPVVDGNLNGKLDEHVRTIQQALYRNRKLAEDGDEQLDYEGGDGPEPTVKDVLAQGAAFIERDEDGEPTGLWDGNTDQLAEDWVNSQHGEEPEEPDADDPAYEPHPYVDTAHATCGYKGCGQPAGAAIHTTSDEPVIA